MEMEMNDLDGEYGGYESSGNLSNLNKLLYPLHFTLYSLTATASTIVSGRL